jgi:cell division protein ZapB
MAAYSLTGLDFSNYSAAMDEELSALEERIRQAVELCQRLRAENTDLRQRLANMERDNKRLAEKINGAKVRLEGLLRQIPE